MVDSDEGKGFSCSAMVYRCAYFFYVVITPVFLQYIMWAPMPPDHEIFKAVPGRGLHGKDVAEVSITPLPMNEIGALGCRDCGLPGYWNWRSVLEIKDEDRRDPTKSSYGLALYPVLFLSQDWEHWIVIADSKTSVGKDSYIGKTKETSDVETLGCLPKTESDKKHNPANFSLSEMAGAHDILHLVACVVQGFAKVEYLQSTYGGSNLNPINPLEEHCVAIGSVCGSPCNFYETASESCDSSSNKIPNEFLVRGSTIAAGEYEQLSLSHDVTIRDRHNPGHNALNDCSFCSVRCADADWKKHCKEKDDTGDNCEEWKCKDPPEEPDLFEDDADELLDLNWDVDFDDIELSNASVRRLDRRPLSARRRRSACNIKWSCHNEVNTGLKIEDLFVDAEFDPQKEPMADNGGLYTVLFSGTSLAAPRSGSDSPTGNWQVVYTPLMSELLMTESNVSSQVTIDPTWCYLTPGFTYVVACLTAQQVLIEHDGTKIDGPPFNDRCVAVGGQCGGACGSQGTQYTDAKQKCPAPYGGGVDPDETLANNWTPMKAFLSSKETDEQAEARRLGHGGPMPTNTIPHSMLVGDIKPQRSSDMINGGLMFHIFIVCMTLSFVVTATTYFPGNFRAYYPTHTWEELRDHGYIMQEFCACVAFGVSKGEDKFFVLRNWLGKLSSLPQFQASEDGPVFQRGSHNTTKWIDVFADEGHREGARQMFAAYAGFLGGAGVEANLEFVEAWAKNLRYIIWEEAGKASAFDLSIPAPKGGKARPILPTTKEQSEAIHPSASRSERVGSTPPGYKGVHLTDDQLERLVNFFKVYDATPRSMKLRTDLKMADDCIMTFPVDYGENEAYMIYAARGNPEEGSKRDFKTRRLIQYHWACLSANSFKVANADSGDVELQGAEGGARSIDEYASAADREDPLLRNDSAASSMSTDQAVVCDEIIAAVNRELQETEDNQPHESYGERYRLRVDEQCLWEKCRCCYGKIVGQRHDPMHGTVLLLDDVSAAFHELMQSQTFRDATGCGYPKEVTTTTWSLRPSRRKRKTFATGDEQSRSHRIIAIPKKLLEPYFGVRGKAGAMNFVNELLRQRTWIYPALMAQEAVQRWEGQATRSTFIDMDVGPPKPRRYALFGIFDVRHQPHNDFWNRTLPAFFYHNTLSFDYEVNNDVALVQAPQSFASIRIVDDYLDVNNGLLFNMMNIIRNCVGGVTSCGTNGIWLIDTTQTWAEYGGEFFDSRSKIEDTASSHRQFVSGKRSVYVHEVVATGIAKLNAAYLGATQRWAEGAVQIFWLHFFIDRCRPLWCMLFFVLFMYFLLFGSLYLSAFWWPYFWCCPPVGWCLRQEPFWIEGQNWPLNPIAYITRPTQIVCTWGINKYKEDSSTNWGDAIALQSITDYIRMFDFACWWIGTMFVLLIILCIVGRFRRLPWLVRTVIMFENCTYFWSSPTVFFWVGLSAYMILCNDTPFHFPVVQWMIFSGLMQASKYVMQQKMKNAGGCDEMSIWRSQQMFFVAAPLHMMSLCQGTAAAYGMWKHGLDKSFWSATDHGQEVVNFVKMWTGCIFAAAGISIITLVTVEIAAQFDDNFGGVGLAQWMALMLIVIQAITVWTPVIDIWGGTSQVRKWREDKVNIKTMPSGRGDDGEERQEEDEEGACLSTMNKFCGLGCSCWSSCLWGVLWCCMQSGNCSRRARRMCATCMFWGRSKSYMLRWAVDLGLPIAFILSAGGAQPLLWLAAYANTSGVIRF